MIASTAGAGAFPSVGPRHCLLLAPPPPQQQQERQQVLPMHHHRFFSSTSSSSSDDDDDKTAGTAASEESPSSPSDKKDSEDASTTTPPPPGADAAAAAAAAEDSTVERMEFQAETRQLLDIVTHSLYTDKEVFLRELISNASDALEKLRHVQATNAAATVDAETPLEIRIELDEATSTVTVSDTGMGMTRDEMVSNLGTIAKSGSKGFLQELQQMQQQQQSDTAAAAADSAALLGDPVRGIIGKFGVGFYSAFMVADRVQVRSRSALASNEGEPRKIWTSDGTGKYEIADLDDSVRQDRGSSVVVHLKEDHWDFCDENRIEQILKRYSNFVNFPIYLNGTRVNTQRAIWSENPKDVSDEQYSAFYKYIATAMDDPLDVYHFRADAPLEVKALFFVPSFHSEKYGMARMEPGVSLYSRKVLIEHKSADILPDWLRFVKGVVDSEDLPLQISREKPQDSALVAKLKRVLTRKIIAHLAKMCKDDRSKYLDEFYKEYSFFLKEGICQEYDFQQPLAKLLFFETSKTTGVDKVSLDEYIANCRPEQKDIYYLVAPTRDAALNSPYLEAFDKANVEVLFLHIAIDDFVMANLAEYEGRKLVSVEKGDIDLSALTPKDGDDGDEDKDKKDKQDTDDDDDQDKLYQAEKALTAAECLEFCDWFKKEVGPHKVASCTVTKRLCTSPAIVTDTESGAMRRMMRLVDTQDGTRDAMPLPKQHVEINPKHAMIAGMYQLSKTEPALARTLAAQVFDNCLVAAGLLDDGRSMLPRINDLLLCLVKDAQAKANKEDGKDNDGGLAEDSDSDSDSSSDEGERKKDDKDGNDKGTAEGKNKDDDNKKN